MYTTYKCVGHKKETVKLIHITLLFLTRTRYILIYTNIKNNGEDIKSTAEMNETKKMLAIEDPSPPSPL